ncbi:MAG: crossover junction endodeoxyribonuclease RuvC [Syntrophales bacterium]|nr:crossover junction endodeoxyribonuclease RuvC [Syntrophales bacterium]
MLGIDPGSHITGYGAIEKRKNSLVELVRGEIRPARQECLSSSLVAIYDQLLEVIDRIAPDAISIEDIFYGKNVKSLIKQGHVRGVAILAGAMRRIQVFEYTPLEIKQAVVGYGRAEKSQVQKMVKAILQLSDTPTTDAADALAAAICHINSLKVTPI